MTLPLLAWLGGVLTIVSPCVLPVLPFVFSRAGQPFRSHGLPMLAAMAATFTVVATLAAVGGNWVVTANEIGRTAAMALLALFALALLWPRLAAQLTRPLVAAGERLAHAAETGRQPRIVSSLLLGVATGLLWAPCAGPILGLILTGAALQGANTGSTALLAAFATGAAMAMAATLCIGGRVFAALKRSLGAGEWLRRGLGGAMLAGVVAIALGLDTGLLARLSTATTGDLEQALVDRLAPHPERSNTAQRQSAAGTAMMTPAPGSAMMAPPPGAAMMAPAPGSAMMAPAPGAAMMAPAPGSAMMAPAPGAAMMAAGPAMQRQGNGAAGGLPDHGLAPTLDGATGWLNSAPLAAADLHGKVVLIDFWTYSCINCLRTLPWVKAWQARYRDQGFVVVGVHTPEFAFERSEANVRRAVQRLGIDYPVALDNQFAVWRAFANRYWPAHYLIDAQGKLRYWHFGEGNTAETERTIQQLLQEAGAARVARGLADPQADGVQLAADMDAVGSHETYLGYERAEHFASTPSAVPDQAVAYTPPSRPTLNAWGLDGRWTIGPERATLAADTGRILFRFQSRDLHLVLGPGPDGKPVRFRVQLDGAAPAADHGMDSAADGSGLVTEERLYQLIRQRGDAVERTFSIEFLDPGVSAYAFTFG